ncbi:MAG: hypothetical protein A2Z88_06765 [Omnitrophica WOR_2 bacterium GWA2_47_8]|nr:MAG: hypothetical protein A2Z88_06765 [Omnitrophica WOR_2 bacterium GWA2_47_8]
MDINFNLIDFILHLDHHINALVDRHGSWTYLIIFLIIFCETGLVFTPFLPGDSLLFVLGTLAAVNTLELSWLMIILSSAAILGDTVNYWIGSLLAPKIFRKEHIRFLNQKHLEKTHKFYEKYGPVTIIIARFVPIVRTFAPFLAGVGSMHYGKFLLFNITGGLLWVNLCILTGYFFGNIPIVKENFSVVVLGIIVLSLVPIGVEFLRHRASAKTAS